MLVETIKHGVYDIQENKHLPSTNSVE